MCMLASSTSTSKSTHAHINCPSGWLRIYVCTVRLSISTTGLFMAMGCAGRNYSIDGVSYFHQPCVSSNNQSYQNILHCKGIENASNYSMQCSQFCDCFREYVPHVYSSVSAVSALCCLGVFLTYTIFPRLRRSGYSSKIFLYR